jgi:hypothetical protein
VIGVMPPLPDIYPQTDLWPTLIPDFEFMKWRGNKFLVLYGKLKPDGQDRVYSLLRLGAIDGYGNCSGLDGGPRGWPGSSDRPQPNRECTDKPDKRMDHPPQ